MKTTMLKALFILWSLYMAVALYGRLRSEPGGMPQTATTSTDEASRGSLLWAIGQVESGGNPDAIGQDGELGILQIRPIMVEEVNRISRMMPGHREWSLEDRQNPLAAREMFYIYSDYWSDIVDDHSDEGIARRWNGGPRGHLKKSTEKYWDRVRNIKGARDWTK